MTNREAAAATSEAAQSLATMIDEWVTGGIAAGTDWRNGLAKVIELRLARFPLSPDPSAFHRGAEAMNLRPIAEAPKDRPILAWCEHADDPYEDYGRSDRLTTYAAWVEGLGEHVDDGFNVIEWGGGYDDSNAPEGPRETMSDWWFLRGSNCETPANPTRWCELPLLEAPPSRDDATAASEALRIAREVLEAMLAEWDKMTRYGSPLAKSANENVRRAREALARLDALAKGGA